MPSPSVSPKHRLNVVVRAFEPDDIEAAYRIESDPSVIAGALESPFCPSTEVRERWLSSSPMVRRLAAQVDGHVVGLATLHLRQEPRLRHVASFTIAVHSEAQGRGVGGALLDALIGLAERWCGVLRLELTATVDNGSALSLFRSRGFVVEGVSRAYTLRDGVLVDAVHLARVATRLPYPRQTAEESTVRRPPQLAARPKPREEATPAPRKKRTKRDLPN